MMFDTYSSSVKILREQITFSNVAIIASSFLVGVFLGKNMNKMVKWISKKSLDTSLQNSPTAVIDQRFTRLKGLTSVNSRTKLVLVIRNDLSITRGKAASQCAHGSLMAYKSLIAVNPGMLHAWEFSGQAKVVLKAPNLQEIQNIVNVADTEGVLISHVYDAGKTQVAHGTLTVIAVGPGPVELIDKVTGHLKLY